MLYQYMGVTQSFLFFGGGKKLLGNILHIMKTNEVHYISSLLNDRIFYKCKCTRYCSLLAICYFGEHITLNTIYYN